MKKNSVKQKRYFHDIMKLGGKKRNFLGKTFSTKFFLKFCSNMVDQSFVCYQILNYEPENRTKDDIDKASSWIRTLKYFYDFISLKETEEYANCLITKLTWVLFRKSYHKNTIVKRAGEQNNTFFINLEGNLLKLDLVIYREILSIEEYLIYLIKMKLMNENEIINKCLILNKSFIDINENSIKNYCIKNCINNYENMKKKAIKELNDLGLDINENYEEEQLNNDDIRLKSIDNYLKIFMMQINPKRDHAPRKAFFKFYILKYEKNGKIDKGFFFGNFLKEELKENSTYISVNNCNICVLNKELHYNEELYESMVNKKKKIFDKLKHKFFIFHHIKDDIFYNNYSQFMVYKKYYKGDKIFLQNSFYEGIFLIKRGDIKISINTSIDEMYNLITYLTYALNGFNDYVSGFTSKDYINEQIEHQNQRIKSHHTLDHETVKLYLEKNNYELMSLKEYNIIGTNESFDHQTKIYNFSAECNSDEAIIYFLPKKYLNIIINKEKMVYNSLIQLVEFRIKNIIWKVKNFINIFENKIKKYKSKTVKLKNNENLYLITENNNKNIFDIGNKIKNNSLKNISNIIKRNNLYNSCSKSNLNKSNKYKNLFLSQEINNDIIYTFRKTKNIYSLTNAPQIPILNNKEKNRVNQNPLFNKYSNSQSKKNITTTIPKAFPYLIMDSFVKRELCKENKDKILQQIKATNNIKTIKIQKLYLKNNDY